MKTYAVDLTKEMLTFSAAHFITFAGNICEAIHGHNYGVSCRVEGPLDKNRYVIDFIELRDNLAKISKRLDHHVILPTGHSNIKVTSDDKEALVTFENKRWVFPVEDCVLLPVTNTTAEEIASYFIDQLLETLSPESLSAVTSLIVRIDENQGQWGECQKQLK